MKTTIIIPARFGSTRLPGKPFTRVSGTPLLARIVHVANAAAAGLADTEVVVATDHQGIAELCDSLNVKWIMTDHTCASGTERVFQAHERLETNTDFILNLQGDAPFVSPRMVRSVVRAAVEHEDAMVVTPVVRLDWIALDALREAKKETPFSGTTCIRDQEGYALWFSKQIIPSIRNESELRESQALSPVLQHVGLYGYRAAGLRGFFDLSMGNYERLEQLEQLRFIEHGVRVFATIVDRPTAFMSGIDSPQDVARAEALIRTHGDPMDGTAFEQ